MIFDSNCVEVILFYGHRGDLVMKMAETCKCEESLVVEFINKYFHFLTEDQSKLECSDAPKDAQPE